VVIESGVKHDHHTRWNLFFFVLFSFLLLISRQVHKNDTDTTTVHFRSRFQFNSLIYKYKHINFFKLNFLLDFLSRFLKGVEIDEETFLVIYV
jgi:hypothetical protein